MATELFKLQAMIVDSILDSRMKLKQATTSCNLFSTVTQIGSLSDAQAKLSLGGDHWDVVFVSCHFDESEALSFVAQAKENQAGQDAAYILVLQAKEEGTAGLAQRLLQGVDGFLYEPYSINSLTEITQLAARVRKERREAREKIAMTLLVTDVMNQLDMVSYIKSAGYETTRSVQKFRELCAGFKNFSAESVNVLMEIMIRLFSQAPPPKKVMQVKQYKGASQRVRQNMEKKIIEEVQKMNVAEPAAKPEPEKNS